MGISQKLSFPDLESTGDALERACVSLSWPCAWLPLLAMVFLLSACSVIAVIVSVFSSFKVQA